MTDQAAGRNVSADRWAMLEPLAERLTGARRVVLTTHVNADGDGTGSQAAVASWLERRGVRVTIVNPTPYPELYRFLLHREGLVADLGTPAADAAIAEADLALVLDTSEPGRIAPLDQLLDPERTWVLDHHPPGPKVVGRGGVRDATASATGELVHDLIAVAGDRIDLPTALGIYVALVTDTGSFRFSNTTPRAHAIAADLLASGIDPEEVFRKIYAAAPPRRLALLREALARLGLDEELGITWLSVPLEVTRAVGAEGEDFDGLIDHARSVAGTEVALLLRETEEETKVSLRSSGAADVNRIARRFGGGGHVKASGATLRMPLDAALPLVLDAVRDELRSTHAPRD